MGFFFFVLQSFKLLGFLDVKNVPCARESVLYGSLGSLVMGLGHFLATSKYSFWVLHIHLQEKSNFYLLLGVINSGKSYKLFSLTFQKILVFLSGRVRRSCDVAVGGFICTMLGYWYVKCFFNFTGLCWLNCTTWSPCFSFQKQCFTLFLKQRFKNVHSKASSSFSPKYLSFLKGNISMCLNVYIYIFKILAIVFWILSDQHPQLFPFFLILFSFAYPTLVS